MASAHFFISFLLCFVLVNATVIPYKYPLFKQCDPAWGNKLIGTSTTNTICDVGCLMSSVSMALNGKDVEINGNASNPLTLNNWLVANGGYVDADELQESVVPQLDTTHVKWVGSLFNNTALSPAQIKTYLNDGSTIVIYNVDQGRHFVLGTGYDDTDVHFYVNDPGFERDYYNYTDIVGYRIFSMTSA